MGTAYASVSIFYTPVGGVKTSLGSAFGTILAEIETKALNIGRDQFVYYIDQITTHLSNRSGQKQMVLEIYGSDDENGEFELLDTIDLSLEDPGWIDPPGMRYYKLVFSDPGVLERWKLHGFDVYGEPGGEEF